MFIDCRPKSTPDILSRGTQCDVASPFTLLATRNIIPPSIGLGSPMGYIFTPLLLLPLKLELQLHCVLPGVVARLVLHPYYVRVGAVDAYYSSLVHHPVQAFHFNANRLLRCRHADGMGLTSPDHLHLLNSHKQNKNSNIKTELDCYRRQHNTSSSSLVIHIHHQFSELVCERKKQEIIILVPASLIQNNP